MNNRDAYVILNSLPGIGPVRVTQLLTFFGEPARILAASAAELSRVPGIGEQLAGVLTRWQEHVNLQEELELAEQAGVQIVTREDDAYPARLREIHDPPLCLYVRGSVEALAKLRFALAVVGSRHTTLYGIRMTEMLTAGAVMAGWTVVSGLALGIDTVAHQETVKLKGCTIAVLGSGLSRIYPQENVDLARQIVESGGALISEFPLRFPPDRRTFPMRNRVISGMTLGTLVVEAGSKSGSLITANQALEQGRQVFAVPGRVDSPQSRGCHALIKDGAKLVETFADIIEEFSSLPGLSHREARLPGLESAAVDSGLKAESALALTDFEQKITAVVREAGECSIDELIARLGEPASNVLGALVSLEIRRVISQLPGKRVTLKRV